MTEKIELVAFLREHATSWNWLDDDAPEDIKRQIDEAIDALIAERDALQDGNETLLDHIGDLVSRLQRAEAEAAGLREDAERYRWLRPRMAAEELDGEHAARVALSIAGPILHRHPDDDYNDEFDAAIDAARATTTRAAEGR